MITPARQALITTLEKLLQDWQDEEYNPDGDPLKCYAIRQRIEAVVKELELDAARKP